MSRDTTKPPVSRAAAAAAVVFIAVVGFVLGVTGVPEAVAIGIIALMVAVAVAIVVPRWTRRG
jgi:hypothetical protein